MGSMDGSSSSAAQPTGPLREPGETYWTVGDAADRAGVPYVQLIEWIRRGDLEVAMGGRQGKEVRLVKATDLAALVPGLDPRATGAAVLPSVPPRPVAPEERGAAGDGSGLQPAPAPAAATRAEAQLRAELDEATARIAELEATREAMGHELEELRRQGPADRPRPARLSAAQGPPSAVARPFVPADRESGATRALGTALLMVAFLGLGALLARTLGDADRSGDVGIAAAEASTAGAPGLADWLPRVAPAAGSQRVAPPFDDQPDDAPEDLRDAGAAPARESDPAAAEPFRTMPVARVIEASAPRNIAPVPGATLAEEGAARASGKRWLADILRHEPGLQGTPHGVHPCAYAALGDDVDPASIGPCFGGVFLDDPAGGPGLALATHRVNGVPCCVHHAFVERMTRASADSEALARIAREAATARSQGVVPPLLRLRAERSARHFVEDVIGARWHDAGLGRVRDPDEGNGLEHRWELLPAAGDAEGEDHAAGIRLRLRSWVVEREGTSPRAYEMVMSLRSVAPGDLRESFRWLGAESRR